MFPVAGTDVKEQFEPDASRLVPQGLSIQVASKPGQQPVVLSVCPPTEEHGKPIIYVLNSTDSGMLDESCALECYGAEKDLVRGEFGQAKKMMAESPVKVDLEDDEVVSSLDSIEFTEFKDVERDVQCAVRGKLSTIAPVKSQQGVSLIVGTLAHPSEPRSLGLFMFGNIDELTYPVELFRGKEVMVVGSGAVDMNGTMKLIVNTKIGFVLLREEHQTIANASFVPRYLNVVQREKMRPFLELDAGKDILKRLVGVATTLKTHTRSETDLILESRDGCVLLDSYEHLTEICAQYVRNGKKCWACKLKHWLCLEFGGQSVTGCVLQAHVPGGTTVDVWIAFDVLVKLCRMMNLPLVAINHMLSKEELACVAQFFKSSVRCRAIVGARKWVINGRHGVNKLVEIIDIVRVANDDKFVQVAAVSGASVADHAANADANGNSVVVVVEEPGVDDVKVSNELVLGVEEKDGCAQVSSVVDESGVNDLTAQVAASFAAKLKAKNVDANDVSVTNMEQMVDEDGDIALKDSVPVRPRRSKRQLETSQEEQKKEEVTRPRKRIRRSKK